MGIGVGIDLPVAMSYLAEFSRFTGKGNKAARLAARCPMVRRLDGLLPDYLRSLFRRRLPRLAVARLAAVWRRPALLIIAARSKFMNESPLWAANQEDPDFGGAHSARLIRHCRP